MPFDARFTDELWIQIEPFYQLALERNHLKTLSAKSPCKKWPNSLGAEASVLSNVAECVSNRQFREVLATALAHAWIAWEISKGRSIKNIFGLLTHTINTIAQSLDPPVGDFYAEK